EAASLCRGPVLPRGAGRFRQRGTSCEVLFLPVQDVGQSVSDVFADADPLRTVAAVVPLVKRCYGHFVPLCKVFRCENLLFFHGVQLLVCCSLESSACKRRYT